MLLSQIILISAIFALMYDVIYFLPYIFLPLFVVENSMAEK